MIFTDSLKSNFDFKAVYRSGRSKANKYLIMYIKENDLSGKNRIGISVSKKVGNSVVRHKVKRLIKESYRLNEDMFNSGLDIVVIARSNAKVACFCEMQSALLHVSKLLHILKV
ncbi:MAG: ribonuclease P protein component [Lachnospiraceae bacterium]|nr:ribonuclease P protein component [Lachnospiraceae bacterium]